MLGVYYYRPPSPTYSAQDRYSYDVVKKWVSEKSLKSYTNRSSNSNLFDFGMCLVPVFVSHHWLLMVADMSKAHVFVIDSLPVSDESTLFSLVSVNMCALHT